MILALLLGCAAPGDTGGAAESPAFTPAFGRWTAHRGQTWEGDCALADPSTYAPEEETWALEADRYGFAVRDEAGYRIACVLEDRGFTCALPVIADDLASLGYDVQATYTPTWSGTFPDEARLEGTWAVAADCQGADCDLLTGYGEDFRFPCTAETGLEAARVEG